MESPPIMLQINSHGTDHKGSSLAHTDKIRVLLAEDHPVLRYTLRSVLKPYSDLEIVGEATNGEEAVLKAEQFQPTIVLMDISMPKLDGIAATRRIKAISSRIAVLGLSVYSEGDLVDAMLRAGAAAMVPKERAAEDLYDVIQRTLALSPHSH